MEDPDLELGDSRTYLAGMDAAMGQEQPEPLEPPPPPSSPEDIAEAEAAVSTNYRAQLDDVLASESHNSAWARQAAPRVEEAFRQWLPDSTVGAATCGESLCRIEVQHDDDSGHERLLTQLRDGFPWAGGATLQRPDTQRGNLTVIYIAPEGQPLPVQEEA